MRGGFIFRAERFTLTIVLSYSSDRGLSRLPTVHSGLGAVFHFPLPGSPRASYGNTYAVVDNTYTESGVEGSRGSAAANSGCPCAAR